METPGEEIKKKPNMKPPGHWDCKGKQGRGLEKERSDNQMPRRRQIRKPVQDSKSRLTELTDKTPGMEKLLRMPHFLIKAHPKVPDREMQELKLKSSSTRARWAVQRNK